MKIIQLLKSRITRESKDTIFMIRGAYYILKFLNPIANGVVPRRDQITN